MATKIHLGRDGFNGWLLNALLRDPVHDFGGSHASMPSASGWLQGGGVMDITTFKQMLIKIISKSSCEQNDGKCIQDLDENIDSSLLLKAYNSVVDDVIYDKIIYAFFIDLHGEGGDNTEFIDKTEYMQHYKEEPDEDPDEDPNGPFQERDEQLKTQQKVPEERERDFTENLPDIVYPDEVAEIPDGQGQMDVPRSAAEIQEGPAEGQMDAEHPAAAIQEDPGQGQMDASVPRSAEGPMDYSDFGGGEPPQKIQKSRVPLNDLRIVKEPPYHIAAPGTVTYLIEILTLKKNANRLTSDDTEMLRLLEGYANYNYLTNFNEKKKILIKTLGKVDILSYSKWKFMIQGKIESLTLTNYNDDYNTFYIFYNSIMGPNIPLPIKNILDDFIRTFKNFELFSYVIFSNQIKNDITLKINAPIKPKPFTFIIPVDSRINAPGLGVGVGVPDASMDIDAPRQGHVFVPVTQPILGKRREIPSNGGNNVNHKGGNQPTSKYNLYVNTVRKIIGGYSNIQRGGTHSANWLTMLKCFAFNFMGITHNGLGVLLSTTAAAPVPYSSYRGLNPAQLNSSIAYNNMEWFDFEKSSLCLKYSTAHIEDDVIKYILGKFSDQRFKWGNGPNEVTIDDLTQVRIGQDNMPTPANITNKQLAKYSNLAANSINNIKFPIFGTSVLNGDLFKLLANTFINYTHTGPHAPINPAAGFNRYNMKYIINNECNQLEQKDAHNMDILINNAAPNVLTNYPSYIDPGSSGSSENIIVDEFGIYNMGFCGDTNNDSYALHLNPSTETHTLTIRNTNDAGNATYNFSRRPANFGATNWGGTTGVTAKTCIACAVTFLQTYMNAAQHRSYPLGKIPATWKNLQFLCTDFGKRQTGGPHNPGNAKGTERANVVYPEIAHNIHYSDTVNNTNFAGVTGAGWTRLPAFFIFYTFMLFKGTGDISQEMTSLIKWGGIVPSAGAGPVTPDTPKRSAGQVATTATKFAINNNHSTINPYYVKFDANGNAPRLLLSHDRPSGARFILTMHHGIKYLRRPQTNAALKLVQNNINTFAFGGYIGDMRKIIFAKVNTPLFFGAGAGVAAKITASTKNQSVPLLTVHQIQAAVATPVVAPAYGGKKQRKTKRKNATKKTRKNATKKTKKNKRTTKRKNATKKTRKNKRTTKRNTK